MAVLPDTSLRDGSDLLDQLHGLLLHPTPHNMAVNYSSGLNRDRIPLAVLLQAGVNSTLSSSQQADLDQIHSRLARSLPETVGLCLAYCAIFVCSLLANSLVCFLVLRQKRLRTVTNTFIANLALSDIAITVFNVPLTLLRFVYKDWMLGYVPCALGNFTLMVSIYVSTFTMTAIALDRYMVILYPLRPRLSVRRGCVVIFVTWVIAIALSLPFAIYARVDSVDLMLTTTRRCVVHYPEPSDVHERYVTLGTFVAQYIIPMVITGVAYTHIVYRVWSREVVGQHTLHQQVSHEKSRRRTIKLLLVVVAVFSVCWLPLNLYHVLTDFHPDSSLFQYSSTTYLCLHWLALSSCCHNPFIYCWLNAGFRKELKAKFTCHKRSHSGGFHDHEADHALTPPPPQHFLMGAHAGCYRADPNLWQYDPRHKATTPATRSVSTKTSSRSSVLKKLRSSPRNLPRQEDMIPEGNEGNSLEPNCYRHGLKYCTDAV